MTEPLEPFTTQAEQQAAEEAMRSSLPAGHPEGVVDVPIPRSWLDAFVADGVPYWAAVQAWDEAADEDSIMQVKARAKAIAEEAMRKAAGIDGERERLRRLATELFERFNGVPWDNFGEHEWQQVDAVMVEVVDPLLAKIRRVAKLADDFDENKWSEWRSDDVASYIRQALEGGS